MSQRFLVKMNETDVLTNGGGFFILTKLLFPCRFSSSIFEFENKNYVFPLVEVSGSDDAKGLFRFLCGSGGEAFYRWSFWNKVDLLLIITLTTHICFWLKNVHQFSQMEVGRFYERGEFNSLWEPQSIMQGEETWVFVNAALLPARILHYCNRLTQ